MLLTKITLTFPDYDLSYLAARVHHMVNTGGPGSGLATAVSGSSPQTVNPSFIIGSSWQAGSFWLFQNMFPYSASSPVTPVVNWTYPASFSEQYTFDTPSAATYRDIPNKKVHYSYAFHYFPDTITPANETFNWAPNTDNFMAWSLRNYGSIAPSPTADNGGFKEVTNSNKLSINMNLDVSVGDNLLIMWFYVGTRSSKVLTITNSIPTEATWNGTGQDYGGASPIALNFAASGTGATDPGAVGNGIFYTIGQSHSARLSYYRNGKWKIVAPQSYRKGKLFYYYRGDWHPTQDL